MKNEKLLIEAFGKNLAELWKHPGWQPIWIDEHFYFHSYLSEPEVIRIEIWIENGNQYIFSSREKNAIWNVPELGEYPNCGRVVSSLEDCLQGFTPNPKLKNIHPALRKPYTQKQKEKNATI